MYQYGETVSKTRERMPRATLGYLWRVRKKAVTYGRVRRP